MDSRHMNTCGSLQASRRPCSDAMHLTAVAAVAWKGNLVLGDNWQAAKLATYGCLNSLSTTVSAVV